MNSDQSFLNKISPYSFVIKFIGVFLVLYYFFPFYRGVVGQGGIIYSSFLDNNFNLITGFTSFLTYVAKTILEFFDFSIFQKNYHTLRIGGSPGISVNPSCLGWGVMSFWTAFIVANNGSFKFKLKWSLLGLAIIILLNISRIVLIVVANHEKWSSITTLDHHQTFNIVSYSILLLMIFRFVGIQKRYDKIRFGQREADHAFS